MEPCTRYSPRDAASTTLHHAVRHHLETFLQSARERSEYGLGVKPFVEAEFRDFLRCGVYAHGFARVRCGDCADEMLVAFSCKRRTVCSSCTGRRAAEGAVHLVDDAFPPAHVRQWVLTFPRHLRFAMLSTQLTSKVLGVWLRALEAFHRKRAKSLNTLPIKNGYTTWPQRFRSAINANIHFHTVTVDDVFALPGPEEEKPTFVRLDAPDAAEFESLLVRLVTWIKRCFEKHQQGKDETFDDALTSTWSASLHAKRSDVGLKPGPHRHEAFCEGFSLHCGVRLHESDRAGIERLCRYGARCPLANGRRQKVGDDKYQYTMKRMVNGRTVLELTGVELLRKLSVATGAEPSSGRDRI